MAVAVAVSQRALHDSTVLQLHELHVASWSCAWSPRSLPLPVTVESDSDEPVET